MKLDYILQKYLENQETLRYKSVLKSAVLWDVSICRHVEVRHVSEERVVSIVRVEK
jgi:hypothetical protein